MSNCDAPSEHEPGKSKRASQAGIAANTRPMTHAKTKRRKISVTQLTRTSAKTSQSKDATANEQDLFKDRLAAWHDERYRVRSQCDAILLDMVRVIQNDPSALQRWSEIILKFGSFDSVVRLLQTLNPLYKDVCFALPWLESI
jgi:hypothetical protein